MNNNTSLTISDAGSMLLAAGLIKLNDSVSLGLILIGVGALLKIVVAILQKEGVPVQAS
jgi:hypothetical protein